jgi:hypothetical protein
MIKHQTELFIQKAIETAGKQTPYTNFTEIIGMGIQKYTNPPISTKP